jgi:hypothetical protein
MRGNVRRRRHTSAGHISPTLISPDRERNQNAKRMGHPMVVPELINDDPPYSFLLSRRWLPNPGADLKKMLRTVSGPLVRRRTVLKKAGIIVAAAATGLLAVSSVAFADTTEGNITNDCAFGNSTGETSQFVDGGSNLLASIANLVTGAVVNAPVQTNALNCTNLNVEDVIDQDSNNTTRTLTETEIEDSFNQSHHRR